MCEGEHPIMNTNSPLVLCLTDHSFVSCLTGNRDNCIGVVRLENGSLSELVDLFFF